MYYASRAAKFTLVAVVAVSAIELQAAAINITGSIRDFADAHPDFESVLGVDAGIVQPILGPDGKPVYVGQAGSSTTHGAVAFDQWYRDTPGINLCMPLTITLDNTVVSDPGIYTYINNSLGKSTQLSFYVRNSLAVHLSRRRGIPVHGGRRPLGIHSSATGAGPWRGPHGYVRGH
jgi:hypothetical protein